MESEEESVELLSAVDRNAAAPPVAGWRRWRSWQSWRSVLACDACDPLSEYYALRARAGRTRRRAKLPRLFYVVAAAQVSERSTDK